MKSNLPIGITLGLIIIAIVLGLAWANNNRSAVQRQQDNAATNALIGQPLPAMRLTDQAGRNYDMSQLREKTAVLFFTEGLMCYPACWDQIAAFGTDARFNSNNIVAFSVIADPPDEWQTAIAKMPELAKAEVLFDANAAVTKQLGMASMPSSMHPGNLAGHTYVIVDKDGIIRDVIDDATMSVNNDKLIKKIADL